MPCLSHPETGPRSMTYNVGIVYVNKSEFNLIAEVFVFQKDRTCNIYIYEGRCINIRPVITKHVYVFIYYKTLLLLPSRLQKIRATGFI